MNYLAKIALSIGLSAAAAGCGREHTQREVFNLPEANGNGVTIQEDYGTCFYNMRIGNYDNASNRWESGLILANNCNPEHDLDIKVIRVPEGSDLEKLANPATIRKIADAVRKK